MKKINLLLLVAFLVPTFAWADSYVLTVEGLVCDFCAQGIEKKLNKEFKDQKIQNIHVDLNDKKVTFDADKIDEKKLGVLIKDAGYNLKNIDVKPVESKKEILVTPSESKADKK